MPRGAVMVKGVECVACGKRFSSLRNVRGHFKETGHEKYRNVKVSRVRVNPSSYQ